MRTFDTQERLTKIKIKQVLEALMLIKENQGYSYFIELFGVGYNLKLESNNSLIALNIGFKDTKRVNIPEGIRPETVGDTILIARGFNKDQVTQFLAGVRQLCPSEKFKYKKKGFSKIQTLAKLANYSKSS